LHLRRRWGISTGKPLATETIKKHRHDLRAKKQLHFPEKSHSFKINPMEIGKIMWNKKSHQAPGKQKVLISRNVLFSIKERKKKAKLLPSATPRIDISSDNPTRKCHYVMASWK